MLNKNAQKCHSSQMHYSFYKSIQDIPNINWSLLGVEKNPFFNIGYFQTLEESNTNTNFTYIIFKNTEAEIIGFATTQLVNFNTKELSNHSFPCTFSESLKNQLLKNIDASVLICGNVFACGEHGFAFNANLVTPTEAYKSLAKALRSIGKLESAEKSSFILIKEFWPTSYANSDIIKEEDFREIYIDANMVLPIKANWLIFDDYLNSMRTKFRSRAKKVLSNSSSLVTKDFNVSDINKYQTKIDELYDAVIKNAYFKMGKLNAHFFMRLKSKLQEQFIFKGYFYNEELIGFYTCFLTKKSVEAFHIGFNYNYKESHNIYSRILYDYVDLAIKHKVPKLQLGRTSETIKSTVGAHPINMKLYIRHRNSISNTLLKPLVDFVSPNTAEIRNPFKKT